MLWDESGVAIDAVYWTVNANEGTKWGTDTDIQLAPTTIAAGTTCPLVTTLLGPSDVPLSSGIVSYAGQAPTIGTVIHRVADGATTWQTNGVASINACNAGCNTVAPSFLLNATVTQPTCGNSDGSISFNPAPTDTYFYAWSFPSTGTVSSVTALAAGTYPVTITNLAGCSIDTTIVLTEDCGGCNVTATVSVVPNSACAPCNYSGPQILINEINIYPAYGDGCIFGNSPTPPGNGEWIELFNPNWCDSVDISGYILGSFNSVGNTFSVPYRSDGMAFVLPQGTIVPPLGFVIVRGANATPSQAPGVIDVVVNNNNNNLCIGGGLTNSRMWFANAGGWFAFYNATGVPQNAIKWGNPTASDLNQSPCIPSNNSLPVGTTTLPTYNQIAAMGISGNLAATIQGQTYRRIPDGASWSSSTAPENSSYGSCNDPANCALVSAIANCNGTATVNVSSGTAPFTYQWNDPLNQTTQTAANLCDGVYQVLVTDADLCTQTYLATVITNPFDLTATIVQPGCNANDGSIAFTPFEATYTYSWTPNVSTTNVASNLAPGTYDLTISEGTCSFDTTVILVNPAAFTTTVSQVNTTCGLDNGSINVEVTPSTGTYSFTWTPNVSTVDSAFALPAGDYSIVITDNICATTQNVTILSSEELSSTALITHTSCAQSDGAINIDVYPPSQYYYTWTSNVSTVDSATNLASGTYVINVTDSTCYYDTTIVVNTSFIPTDLLANITASNCGTDNGEIEISQTDGGIAPYQYSFSGMSFSNIMSIDSLDAGSYIVAVEDANGCEYQESFVVPEIPGPSQILTTQQNPNCGYNNGVIEIVNGVGGVSPYTYTFNNQAVANLIQADLLNGNYAIVASDLYGCTTSENIVLTMEAGLSIVFIPNVFTPNTDIGLTNEVWKVSATCTQTFNCKIFNRWGSLIYEFDDLNGEWNGKTTKGEDVTDGVYFYKVELGYFDGRSEIFQGHITVIR
jgi:gliding motility-associated-like protein